ncbi:FAD/NAD(P)-binding protein [Aquiflexum lacus]|uniref:FAD/NAD(P)-binding protein n=1 Tax=Aquiflexum lacus TaxID=2483805 RepID=UPI001895593B|nr:FAD/NAD(P)-binding protein [Aquiflexum lacus]
MKVWNSSNLTDIINQNKRFLTDHTCGSYLPESDFRVAIVGGGPKGVYAIERLASVWNCNHPGKDLDIVCFNTTADFGSGPNYQTEQPDFLLMNYNLGKVDFWTDEQEQIVDDRLDLLAFLKRNNRSEVEVESFDYCSRAVTGIYLQYCLCKLIEALPSNIHLHLIVDEVTSIEEDSANLLINSKVGIHEGFSEVICCTGHAYSFGEGSNSAYQVKKSDEIPSSIFRSVYPIQKLQENNYSGKTVAIKGLGLTFVDAVLGITEGKGGAFKRENTSLTYLASKKEPKEIFAFSRTGLPMIARKDDLSKGDFSLRFFTKETVDHLSNKHDKLDFKLHLLPFIQHEFRYQYVIHLLAFISDKVKHSEKTLLEMEFYASGIFPDFTPFDLEKFLSPTFPSNDWHNAVIDYLEETIFPERFDELHQARVAMSALWREIYPLFNKVYAFGKLTGESQRHFDLNYFSRFQRVAYGPPKGNMEKILTLAAADILRFDLAANPKISILDQDSYVKLSNQDNLLSIAASLFIDARIPKSKDLSTQPEYIRKLILNMGAGFFTNGDYKTGSIEMDKEGRLKKQKQISFYGTPTEGWTLDNESLSRSNNNFLSPWAKRIAQNYVNIKNTKINADYPTLD